MFWVPFFFLLCYYALQLHYQYDVGFLCPTNIWHKTECQRFDTNVSTPLRGLEAKHQEFEHVECCRKWTKAKYEEWGKRATSLTTIITFLLGIYVGRIITGWWSRVASIPDIENSLLMMAGLVSVDNPKFQLPAVEDQTEKNEDSQFPVGVLEAKKMIARYGLLSWTLCFCTISPVFNRSFKTLQELEEKGLLKGREMSELKVKRYDII